MSITRYAFVPSPVGPFQFQPTLDGELCTVIVTWGLSGQRYYINVYTSRGVLVCNLPVIGSDVRHEIADLVWVAGKVQVTTSNPHKFDLGDTVRLSVSGASPDAYNGNFEAIVTGPFSFNYPLIDEPALDVSALGAYSYDINLLEGYFASKLVWRTVDNNFEVSP